MAQETPPFARDDTLFGLCHGLGEELGVRPIYFRLALALALFFNPVAVISGYVLAAVALNLFRWYAPLRPAATTPKPAKVAVPNDNDAVSLREAA